MEKNPSSKAAPGKKKSLTPRQLIKRRMEHPDIPITADDLKNMDLHDNGVSPATPETAAPLTVEEKAGADELADEIKKDNTGMSYQPDV